MVQEACERKLWGQVGMEGEELGDPGSVEMCEVGEGASKKDNYRSFLLSAHYGWGMHRGI